ncbi:hypothetical protein DU475_02175 [Rhodopseudomonas sp. WA056]|uniref:Uncharacterized protein n=1 Tax=Rhodopseudomonas palustris (strain DX-1) TaxID=652103 RepID=E6VPA8_RHOPX|nr:hypothetical protein [Rhodopseudomonas sp. WA056]QDL98003.1 hypothetical protein FLL57_12065 [Rhodopseudomonas palustris]
MKSSGISFSEVPESAFGKAEDEAGRPLGQPAGLRYSSPWPWAAAVFISSGLWAGIGWLIFAL